MIKFIYAKPTPQLPPEVERKIGMHGKEWVVVTRDLLRFKRPDQPVCALLPLCRARNPPLFTCPRLES